MTTRAVTRYFADGAEPVQFVEQLSPQEEQDAAATSVALARALARERTIAHGLSLITADFPEVDTLEKLDWLASIFRATVPAARDAKLTRARDVRTYALAKLQEIASMDEAAANAYTPSTDVGWPV